MDVLGDLRSRPAYDFPEPQSDHGIPDALRHIEDFLQRVLQAVQKAKTETTKSSRTESEAETTTTDSALEEVLHREHWEDLQRKYGMQAPTSLALPPRLPIPEVTVPDISVPGVHQELPAPFPATEPIGRPISPEITIPIISTMYSQPHRSTAT